MSVNNFPKEIKEKMHQYRMIHFKDLNLLVNDYTFIWAKTDEGWEFWWDIVVNCNFDRFFQKYPKKSEYPKVMLVAQEASPLKWHKRVVFMEKNEKYIAWDNVQTLKEAEDVCSACCWKYAKDISVEQPIPEYTMEELTEKLGHNFKIKK